MRWSAWLLVALGMLVLALFIYSFAVD